jgi:hypothetical protein
MWRWGDLSKTRAEITLRNSVPNISLSEKQSYTYKMRECQNAKMLHMNATILKVNIQVNYYMDAWVSEPGDKDICILNS